MPSVFNNRCQMKLGLTFLTVLALGVLLPPTAQAENGSQDGEKGASPSLFERIKGGIVHGVEAAGNGIRHGADATAHGLQRGFEATGRGLERGAQATGRGLHKASQKLGLADSSSG